MILLQASDFVGFFNIPVSVSRETETLLTTYINRYEKLYICKLLGVTLGELFIADLANVTQDTRFVSIEDEFYLDDPQCDNKQWHSWGMADMLKGFIFYHFVTENTTILSQNGVTISANEAGTILGIEQSYRFCEKKFNDALESYEAIQWYVDVYAPDQFTDEDLLYPEYQGSKLNYKFGSMF